jgi:hypothetical protein
MSKVVWVRRLFIAPKALYFASTRCMTRTRAVHWSNVRASSISADSMALGLNVHVLTGGDF